MGRYYFDKMATVDESKSISLPLLKKWGCLQDCYSTILTWTNNWGESSTGIQIYLDAVPRPYVQLKYTITERDEFKQDFNYKIFLESKPCQLGGHRYFFFCPLVTNGEYCRKEVLKLYMPNGAKYFACRHCHKLTYEARQDHKHRFEHWQKFFDAEKKVEELTATKLKMYYQGKLTKRYQKYLKYHHRIKMLLPYMSAF